MRRLTLKLLPSCLKYVSGTLPASWKTPWEWTKTKRSAGSVAPCWPASPPPHQSVCVCVWDCVCEGGQLKATTCIVRCWTAPAAKPSGATQIYPATEVMFLCVHVSVCMVCACVVCACVSRKGQRFKRGEDEVRGEDVAYCLTLHNVTQHKQIASAS